MIVLAFFTGIHMAAAKDVIKMTIKEETGKCVGVGPTTCMLVKYPASTDWEFFYGGIKGFNYKEGYRYTILVQRTKRKNVPADASAYEYKLVKVLEKKKITTPVNNADLLQRLDGKTWRLTSINGRSLKDSKATLRLDVQKGRYFANAGCNNMMGGFTYNKQTNAITFGGAASTLMACAPEIMKLEGEFGDTISRQPFTVQLNGDTLQLLHNGKTIMEFTGGQPATK